MEICTIGTAHRSAESFFESLRSAAIGCLVDTRLRATSQLVGFAKARDLQYFVPRLLAARYVAEATLAPTAELLDGYKRGDLDWAEYARGYADLLADRGAGRTLLPWAAAGYGAVALLCSEATPDNCHRRLAAEHLAEAWPGTTVRHL